MAPEAAIDGLLEEFVKKLKPESRTHLIEKRIINPISLGLNATGHFGFFNPATKILWHDLLVWIQSK